MSSVLYCFMCHQKTSEAQLMRIKLTMKSMKYPFLIFMGGVEELTYDISENIVKLPCDDTYIGRITKTKELCKFIISHTEFDHYTHLARLNEDIAIVKPYPTSLGDYSGFVCRKEISRTYHCGKCPPDSDWNTKPYDGFIPPWCSSTCGYILSRNAIRYIAESSMDVSNEIYEDITIAKILGEHGIYPQHIPDMNFMSYPSIILDKDDQRAKDISTLITDMVAILGTTSS